jgi:hypothetical protein
MTDFSSADILLSIITFIIVLVGIFFVIALFHIIRVLNDLRKIIMMIKEGSEIVREDARELYFKIKNEKNFFKKIFGVIVYGLRHRKVPKKVKRKK